VLKDRQAVGTARTQVTTQRLSRQAAAAAAAANAAPPLAGTVAAAEASVVQAKINLATAKIALAQTTLRAPVAGTVAAVNGSVGEESGAGGGSSSSSAASSSSSSSSSSTSSSSTSGFVTLTDLSGMQVVSGFSETDAAKLRVGQPATVTVDALPGQELAAHVIAIDTDATVSSSVVTYNVTFALDSAVSHLRPGMSANVEVVTAEVDNVVNVPTSAVTGSGANATVTVVRKGKQVVVPVVAGLKGDSSTAILSGLAAGQTVVLPSVNVTFASNTGTGTGLGGTSTSTGGTGAAGAGGRGGFLGGGGGFGP
jgi:multidrug efflux pump subunit AcrA (membrane-fusion protein)